MDPVPQRTRAPKYSPHPHVARLRSSGWTIHGLACHVGASPRAVARWSSGYTRPLPVYEAALESLLGASPPKVVRLREGLEGGPVWLVEVRITQRHVRLVVAQTAEEAQRIAFEKGWDASTVDETESIELLDAPLLRDDFEDEEESP